MSLDPEGENISLYVVILVMIPLILMLGATPNVQHLRHFLDRGRGWAWLRVGRHHAGRVGARV